MEMLLIFDVLALGVIVWSLVSGKLYAACGKLVDFLFGGKRYAKRCVRKLVRAGKAWELCSCLVADCACLAAYSKGLWKISDFYLWESFLSRFERDRVLWEALLFEVVQKRYHMKFVDKFPDYLKIERCDFVYVLKAIKGGG